MKSTLGDFCTVIMGQAPSGETYSLVEGIPLIAGAGDFSKGRIRPKKLTTRPTKLSQHGDIVLSIRASIGDKVWSDGEYCLGRGVAGLRPKAALDSAFLWHWLDYAEPALRAKAKGATFLQVNRSDIADLPISLPAFAEQQRIAAILDKADELRAKRRQAIAHLDALTQSIFYSMFGDPSSAWAELTIEDLAAPHKGAIRTGPFGSQLLTSEFTDDGVAVLGIDNAVTNTFAWAQRRYISEEKYDQLRRYRVWPGDLLITIMGTLGRCAIVPRDVPKAINTKHLCCITLNQDLVVPEWLHAYFLQSEIARSYLRQTTKGAIMGGLNMGIIKKMPVSVPPLELQQTFATRVAAVERLKETHRKHLAELDALFASLQSRAFKGEL